MQSRLNHNPQASRIRRQTVEHAFGTLKSWMGATHFLTKTIEKVSTEMSLHVLAYNMKRMFTIHGTLGLIRRFKPDGEIVFLSEIGYNRRKYAHCKIIRSSPPVGCSIRASFHTPWAKSGRSSFCIFYSH